MRCLAFQESGANIIEDLPAELRRESSPHDISGQSEQSASEWGPDSLRGQSLQEYACGSRFELSRRDDAEDERIFEALSQDCLVLLRKV